MVIIGLASLGDLPAQKWEFAMEYRQSRRFFASGLPIGAARELLLANPMKLGDTLKWQSAEIRFARSRLVEEPEHHYIVYQFIFLLA